MTTATQAMTEDDDNDGTYEMDSSDAAFVRSDTHEFEGSHLQPFTGQRFLAAQAMGMTWPSVSADGYRDIGLYRGEAVDAAIVLWLCTLPVKSVNVEAWSVVRALRQTGTAFDEAIKWADTIGISQPNSELFWKGIRKFEDIILEINRSYAVPKRGLTGSSTATNDDDSPNE